MNDVDTIRPKHYQSENGEVWEDMVRLWGEESFIQFALLNAFKYRMRAGKKAKNTIKEDIKKALWYENKVQELRNLKDETK